MSILRNKLVLTASHGLCSSSAKDELYTLNKVTSFQMFSVDLKDTIKSWEDQTSLARFLIVLAFVL